MEALEVRAEIDPLRGDRMDIVFRFTGEVLEYPDPQRLDSMLQVPVSAFAGAYYLKPVLDGPTVEMVFIHPERYMKKRVNAIWYLPDEEAAKRLNDGLNSAAERIGVAADLIVPGDRLVVIRDGKIHIAISAASTGNWKASREFAVSDVAGVRQRRNRLDVDFKSGKSARITTADKDDIARLSDLLVSGSGSSPGGSGGAESADSLAEIERAASLYERGLLTEDEFAEIKRKLIS